MAKLSRSQLDCLLDLYMQANGRPAASLHFTPTKSALWNAGLLDYSADEYGRRRWHITQAGIDHIENARSSGLCTADAIQGCYLGSGFHPKH